MFQEGEGITEIFSRISVLIRILHFSSPKGVGCILQNKCSAEVAV